MSALKRLQELGDKIYPVSKSLIHLLDVPQSRQLIVHFLTSHLNTLKQNAMRFSQRRENKVTIININLNPIHLFEIVVWLDLLPVT